MMTARDQAEQGTIAIRVQQVEVGEEAKTM